MGLAIDDDDGSGALLSQPCAALRGKRCSIYAHRPGCCRTFECRLLRDAQRGAISVERAAKVVAEALERIGRVRELMAQLGQRHARLPLRESCAEALSRGQDSDPDVNLRRAELKVAMSAVEQLIREKFLG